MRILTDCAWLVVEYAVFAALVLLLQLRSQRLSPAITLRTLLFTRVYRVRAKCFGVLLCIPKALLIDIPEA